MGEVETTGKQRSVQQAQTELASRLRRRRREIEHEALIRARAISDPAETADPVYAEGLRRAVTLAVDYAIERLEAGEDSLSAAPPAGLLEQARLAAQSGIGLDTVLRRYTAGHALLVDFLIEEVERAKDVWPAQLRRLLAVISSVFDQLLAAVSEEYARELENRVGFSRGRRRLGLVQRLLAGEPLHPAELDYDLDGSHVALILHGPSGAKQVRRLADDVDRRLLLVEPREQVVWAWLGGRRRLDHDEFLRQAASDVPPHLAIAVGEPALGRAGWRLSHRQATAISSYSRREFGKVTRYADVGLLAAIAKDQVLVESLNQLYLSPLASGRDGGAALRETLRAYFSAGRNISSAAAALAVNRDTVSNRLRTVERRLGQPLDDVVTELDIALRLERTFEKGQPSYPRPG